MVVTDPGAEVTMLGTDPDIELGLVGRSVTVVTGLGMDVNVLAGSEFDNVLVRETCTLVGVTVALLEGVGSMVPVLG